MSPDVAGEVTTVGDVIVILNEVSFTLRSFTLSTMQSQSKRGGDENRIAQLGGVSWVSFLHISVGMPSGPVPPLRCTLLGVAHTGSIRWRNGLSVGLCWPLHFARVRTQ